METLYVWLLTFAGATMVGCLLSSERELGKQRREINWLRRNHRRPPRLKALKHMRRQN